MSATTPRLVTAAVALAVGTALLGPAATASDDPLGSLDQSGSPTSPSSPTGTLTDDLEERTSRVTGGAAGAARDTVDDTLDRLLRTSFAFRGNGYGTSARGGEVPVGSDRTALSSIACTSEAGKKHRNFVEESEVPGLGTVRGVYSRVATRQVDGRNETFAKHKVAEVVLNESPLGTLSISGLVSTTRAFHDGQGFGAFADTKIAGISFTPPGGEPQTIPIPSPGQPITIPGVATLTLGRTIEKSTQENARAYALALSIKVIPTDTVVKIARSASKIERGYKTGIFHGSGVPAKAKVLGELAEIGRVIVQVMPCTGTKGELVTSEAADVNLGDQIVVQGASARQRGKQTATKATGMEGSTVARLELGGGQLVLEAIDSKVKVTRTGDRIKRSGGATFGTLTVGGEPQSLEELDGLEIPGLAKIETGLKKKIKDGLRVIGVRITLLDGSGAVIDLATSKLSIADR